MITMGSFLEEYKKASSLGVALDQFLAINPDHKLALGMKKVYQGIHKEIPANEAIQYATQINYKEYEVEEQLVFLELLFHLLIQHKGVSYALPIVGTVKRLISQDLQPEWKVIPYAIETVIHFKAGNFKKQLETIESELNVLTVNSGRYILLYWTYLILLALLNQFEKLDHHINEFKKLSYENVPSISLEYIYLVRNEEMGLFHENKAIVETIRAKKVVRSIENDIENYDAFLKIILENELPELDEQKPEHWEKFSIYHLIKNEPKKALYWAHKYSPLITDYKALPNISSFYLIRAELANKNINTAKYLLINRKRNGNISLYDDFFWFRLYHNKGETQTAQKYFNLFTATVDKYNLKNRFEYELKLSPEISSKDIKYYFRNYSAPKAETIISNEIDQTHESVQAMQFIVGESIEIKKIKDLVVKFSNVDTNVLITGETGTGKELIAKALWLTGPYKKRPFITINCGAISDHLLQSELFGHKQGAFTGAIQDHKGIFETAENGIVFLDEIGEISQSMQISLLRVLEEKEYRPIGSSENKKLKCKIVAATNRNLAEHVKNGQFRQDLHFRLDKLVIELPPLRNRPSDIPILINHFLNIEYPNLSNLYFDEAALRHLQTIPWDGNIRELRNEMERIRLFNSDKKILTVEELSTKYKPSNSTDAASLSSITKNSSSLSQASIKSPLNLNSKFRKIEELKKLFQKHRVLTRIEVENLLQISSNTAASYINALEQEKYIIKKTNPNAKSNYYEIHS